MKRRPSITANFLAYISIYPVLVVLLIASGITCQLVFSVGHRLLDTRFEPTSERSIRRVAKLPPLTPTLRPRPAEANTAPATNYPVTQPQTSPVVEAPAPVPVAEIITPQPMPVVTTVINQNPPALQPEPSPTPVQIAAQASAQTLSLDLSVYAGTPYATRTPRPSPTPTPESFLDEIVTGLRDVIEKPTPIFSIAGKSLPTLTATPTASPTSTPSPTFTPSSTPTNTPSPTVTPTFTSTPLPTVTPTATNTPLPPPPTATPVPTDTPPPSATPMPEYDFMLAEFYNSPTTNSFMVMYVAIVDINDIPIGDMKIVGTREDHHLTYESPLSTWYYEGYNAPGEVVKSGNVKFEPPGGIETTKWIFYLADAHGNRLSEDIPFNANQDDKQWYFVKFRRKY